MNQQKILLVHLGALGDCLMVTTLARQIKQDFPGCHLTWAISSRNVGILENNPDVDAHWTIDPEPNDPFALVSWKWKQVREEAEARRKRGEFHHVFYTQIYPDNVYRFDGTTRSSTFRNYPHPITVPVRSILELTESEATRVEEFARRYRLSSFKNVVILECSPGSNQSDMTMETGVAVGKYLTAQHDDLLVILTSHRSFTPPNDRIVDASVLSYRENLYLSRCCTFFIGCSSGITWLFQSEKARRIPTLQVLRKNAPGFAFASVAYDLRHWELPTDHLIEVTESDPAKLSVIADDCLRDFTAAQSRWNETLIPSVRSYDKNITLTALRGNLGNLFRSASYFRQRNHPGFPELALLYALIMKSTLSFVSGSLTRRMKQVSRKIIPRKHATTSGQA